MMTVNSDQFENYCDNDNNTIFSNIEVKAANSRIFFNGKNNKVIFGKNTTFKGSIQFLGDDGCFIIGDNSIFIGDIMIGGGGCSVNIGNNFGCVTPVFITVAEKTKVEIGDNCMFNGNIQIRSHDSHPIFEVNTNQRVNHSQSISIGDKVWVGNSVKILKGVSIGDNSIIGSDAVVTKNVPNNSLAVGIPAEIKKNNIFWTSTSLPTDPFPDLNQNNNFS